jgi:hypothetical protein
MSKVPVLAIFRFALLAAVLAGLLAAAARSVAAEDAHGDDGWRRTAYGWERMDDWYAPRVSRGGVSNDYVPPLPAADGPRCDVHPGVLVLLQLVGVGIAMVVAPGDYGTRAAIKVTAKALSP